MLLAIAVFVLHAPAEVVCAPNLQYPCINHFRQCLQSNNITVSTLCIQYKIMMWIVQSLMENTDFMFSIDYRNSVLNQLVKCKVIRKRRNALFLCMVRIFCLEGDSKSYGQI